MSREMIGERGRIPPRLRRAWLVSRVTAALVLAVFLGAVAVVISIPLFIPALIFGSATRVDWGALVSRPGFWILAVVMALVAGARAQHSFETITTPGKIGTLPNVAPILGDLEQDRRRSKAANAAQVTIIATYVALSYLLSVFGGGGLFLFPILYAALLVFYDARPDVAQRIFPKFWREMKERTGFRRGGDR